MKPQLVVRNAEGEAKSVHYEMINSILLNEFLKEHRAFTEEQRKAEQQQKEIEALKAELKEQRSVIQKVCDRIELKTLTSQVAANDQ